MRDDCKGTGHSFSRAHGFKRIMATTDCFLPGLWLIQLAALYSRRSLGKVDRFCVAQHSGFMLPMNLMMTG